MHFSEDNWTTWTFTSLILSRRSCYKTYSICSWNIKRKFFQSCHSFSFTARKTIFYFSRHPEKMVFPKTSRWNMIFLVLSGKMIFLFPKNIILHLRQKMKDDLSQKNTQKYYIFFKPSEKMVFRKRAALGHDLSCIIWKDGIFFPKTWYFFFGQEVRGDLSQEIHGNMIFSVYMYECYKRGVTPLCQKKSKMVLSRKNAPKGDWRSRLTS